MVDHGSGRLVWAAPGRDTKTLRRLFDALGAERSAQITHVSADAADWIAEVITRALPGRDPMRGSLSRGGQGHRGGGCRAAPGPASCTPQQGSPAGEINGDPAWHFRVRDPARVHPGGIRVGGLREWPHRRIHDTAEGLVLRISL